MPAVNQEQEWRRELERELNELQRGFSSLAAESRTFRESVVADLQAIQGHLSNLAEQVHRPAQPTNWIAIGSLLLAVATVMGTIGSFALEPIRAQVSTNDRRVEALLDYNARSTAILSQLEVDTERNETWLRAHEGHIDGYLKDGGRLEARVDELERWLRDVDAKGARKWVNGDR